MSEFLLLVSENCGILMIIDIVRGDKMLDAVINAKDIEYNGRLGKFTYNTKDFEIRYRYTETGVFDVLVYHGEETDGRNIKIPDGINDISYMFENSPIVIPPQIPDSVEFMDYTFKDCASLIAGAGLSKNLKSCGFCYKNCRSLQCGSNMPDTVVKAPYMYDGCTVLSNAGHISTGLVYASGMFRNCKNLRQMPEIPDTIEYKDYMFKGCNALNSGDRLY